MCASISRRSFIAAASGGSIALPFGLRTTALGQTASEGIAAPGAALPDGFPSHEPAVVREVVGKSHFDADGIKKLVEARPELAKAAWDWGFGDWESALGAASHVGRRDIAEILMANGACPNIFTFAMLGQLDAVKAIITANPGTQRVHGPHGITLMRHAKAGKEDALAVVQYLESLGDADQAANDLPVEPAMHAAMLGEYEYLLGANDGSPRPRCEIAEQRGTLMFKHLPDGSRRGLLHQGDGEFHPAGSPHVRIAFVQDTLIITDGEHQLRARKST